MFDGMIDAKKQKRRKLFVLIISVSAFAHLVALIVLTIQGYMKVERHAKPKDIDRRLTVKIKAPPPPPPKKGVRKSKRTKTVKITKKLRVVKADQVQPTKKVKIDTSASTKDDSNEPEGDPDGHELGVTGGTPGGVVGGVIGGTGNAPPPPPPPPTPPKIVLQHVLEQRRISGEKRIVPNEGTKLKIRRDDKTQVIASMKMCLTGSGSVARITTMRSSGYPSYDAKIRAKMSQWRYKPFMVNGKAVPVCTSVTFIYRQTN